MDCRCSLSPNMRCLGRICWWVALFCVFVAGEYISRWWTVPWYYCISFVFFCVCLISDVFYFYLFYFIHRQHVPIQSANEPMSAWTVIFHHVSLPSGALCAHGCDGEQHVLFHVMLDIVVEYYLDTNLFLCFSCGVRFMFGLHSIFCMSSLLYVLIQSILHHLRMFCLLCLFRVLNSFSRSR